MNKCDSYRIKESWIKENNDSSNEIQSTSKSQLKMLNILVDALYKTKTYLSLYQTWKTYFWINAYKNTVKIHESVQTKSQLISQP